MVAEGGFCRWPLGGLVPAASRAPSPPLHVWAAILLLRPAGLYAQRCTARRRTLTGVGHHRLSVTESAQGCRIS